MLVKDLIKELQKIPEDAHLTIWGHFHDANGVHLAVKYYAYDEDLKQEVWSTEESIDYFLKHRDKYPEKVRYRLHENDEDFYAWECDKEE